MAENAFYTEEHHGPFESVSIGDLTLVSGEVLPDCKIAIATFGALNATKDNAILVPTWYSGTSGIIAQAYIGEGRALDPTEYFIIVVNQIGSGLSTSPHNWGKPASAFPAIAIADDVIAQHKVITEHFGISRLKLVIGGSMGGQQTFEWAVRFPDMVERAAPIAATAKAAPHFKVFLDSMADTIISDPAYAGGDYGAAAEVSAGLLRHARLWAVTGWSPEFYRQGRYTALGFEEVEGFVDGFMGSYFAPMDPANLTCKIAKARGADPAQGGDPAQALGQIKAKTFVMPVDHDMFFKVADCEDQCAMIPNGELRVLQSIDGHLALFGADPDFLGQVDANLKELLSLTV